MEGPILSPLDKERLQQQGPLLQQCLGPQEEGAAVHTYGKGRGSLHVHLLFWLARAPAHFALPFRCAVVGRARRSPALLCRVPVQIQGSSLGHPLHGGRRRCRPPSARSPANANAEAGCRDKRFSEVLFLKSSPLSR